MRILVFCTPKSLQKHFFCNYYKMKTAFKKKIFPPRACGKQQTKKALTRSVNG